jgi:predicted PurR-regulated permease PerM
MSDTPPRSNDSLATIVVMLITVAVLYVGSEIFVPFALAILLSFLLAPPVAWLRRIHMPRTAAVALVVTTSVALLASFGFVVGSQALGMIGDLPKYQISMHEKIRSISGAVPGSGMLKRSADVVKELGRDLSEATGAARPAGITGKGGAQEPMTVRVETAANPLRTLQELLGPILKPLGTAGLVIVFVFFVLLAPSDLRDRFIRLAGSDLHKTTEALSVAASRVSRYLVMQLVVNATYAVPLGIGLYLLGVPGAMLWAFLAMVLRFIPYLGPVIAALFPITLAFVVDPGWSMLLWTLALILTLELISNNIVEPWLYGASTGMTPMAVILAAIFWTLLWGTPGLILATPLTVCLVVMGRYVPRLSFIEVLLGSEPVLSAEERLYQRLLAGDIEEAVELAEAEVAASSLQEFHDNTALAALRLAESARKSGSSIEDRQKVADGMRMLVEELRVIIDRQQEGKQDGGTLDVPLQAEGAAILCIGGRGALDTVAALLLAHLLESRGIQARLLPATAITLDAISSLDLTGVKAVCLSYLSPRPRTYARFVVRRLKARSPGLKVVLGAWNPEVHNNSDVDLVAETGADALAGRLNAAVDLLLQAVDPALAGGVPTPPEAAPVRSAGPLPVSAPNPP